jgi:hypothetical protein
MHRMDEAVEEEARYFHDHFEEFYRDYPEQFVVVKDGEVIAAGPHLLELCMDLENKGVRPYDTWLKFMTKRGAKLTL